MKTVLIFIAVVSFAFAQGTPANFNQLLTIEQLWALDQDAFQKATAGLPFRWTSNAKDSARAADFKDMTLFGRPVVEVIARFEKNKLSGINVNFYTRGDSGDLTEPAFKKLLTETTETLNKVTGVKSTVRGKDPTNAVKADGIIWNTAKSQYLLEYSITKPKGPDAEFRAEFIRLEVRSQKEKLGIVATALANSAANKSTFEGLTHVKRDATSGDVWLHDVPMVDQGQKGYCVVASTERVMRYYGRDVDANELAQIANTETDGGTSVEGLRDAMKKVAARLKVRVREIEKMDVKEILELIKDYNRAAKRAGEKELPDQGQMLNVPLIYQQMKPAVLKDAKTHNKADLSRFQREIARSVDSGVPLLWSVHLGIVPEKPELPQASGGHMRLIIGYNSKTQEILYSDSWGEGHELKRMKADDAWTITSTLLVIEPLR